MCDESTRFDAARSSARDLLSFVSLSEERERELLARIEREEEWSRRCVGAVTIAVSEWMDAVSIPEEAWQRLQAILEEPPLPKD